MHLTASFAVPPRDWNYLKSKPEGFQACRPISASVRESLQKKGVIRKAGTRGVIPPTSPKILVIRVQFNDRADFSKTLTAQQSFFTTFRGFYSENSYGMMTCQATLTNVYTIGSVSLYNSETDQALLSLILDAKNAALADHVNFLSYDYIMIYHAGYGEEESRNPSDLWSLFYGTSINVDGKLFDGFTVVPELSPSGRSSLGVVCHEFGHQLGLPDLYNTSSHGGTSTCGAWALMDYPYGADNTGNNPPHLDPWCKNSLGYIDINSRVISGSANLLLGDIETSGATGYYKIPTEVDADEYFIMENRDPSKALFDHSLPGSGILIWHIDTSQINALIGINAVNNNPEHLGIDLVEADSLSQVPVYPPGRAANAFINSDIFVSPLSDTFSGQPTSITLMDFRFFSGYATANTTKLAVATSVALTKAISFPNPAGKGYPHPRAGIISTIVFQASRPPKELTMSLYTIAGERLITVPKTNFNLQLIKSDNFSWVYEYDWDGKNESKENVAPGLYFYRIKADKEVIKGKIAVVR